MPGLERAVDKAGDVYMSSFLLLSCVVLLLVFLSFQVRVSDCPFSSYLPLFQRVPFPFFLKISYFRSFYTAILVYIVLPLTYHFIVTSLQGSGRLHGGCGPKQI